MRKIFLTRGKVALVSDQDYLKVAVYLWHAAKGKRTWYAVRGVRKAGKMTRVYMHREICSAPRKIPVDHRDQNGLNNQRRNLRLATRSKNGQNVSKTSGRTSQFKGVWRSTRPQGFKAGIRVNRRLIHLGYFKSSKEAAKAYDAAARAHFKTFARLNFP